MYYEVSKSTHWTPRHIPVAWRVDMGDAEPYRMRFKQKYLNLAFLASRNGRCRAISEAISSKISWNIAILALSLNQKGCFLVKWLLFDLRKPVLDLWTIYKSRNVTLDEINDPQKFRAATLQKFLPPRAILWVKMLIFKKKSHIFGKIFYFVFFSNERPRNN